MNIFKLPDLGEGLPDAIIREWYVNVGDEVKVDQPLVAMETAKALVDVPSPYNGQIEKLYGDEGDTINTGESLIGFSGDVADDTREDKGTVVAVLRLYVDAMDDKLQIGRVAVDVDYRKYGIAKKMMHACLDFIKVNFENQRVFLSAQTYLIDFYKALGFSIYGEEFLEDGIPHINMTKDNL